VSNDVTMTSGAARTFVAESNRATHSDFISLEPGN
jgi:hypothetical protein